jgi:hypothetical protein
VLYLLLEVKHLFLRRIRGRKSNFLKDIADVPLILVLRNGKVYGGMLDDYEEGVLWLHYCKQLDREKRQWQDPGFVIEDEGKITEDFEPHFLISEIRDILVLPEEYEGSPWFGLEDVLQLYIDPHHKPLRGIDCHWVQEKKHLPECDVKLHEAINFIITHIKSTDGETQAKIYDSMYYIRNRLIIYGAKIP